MAGSRPAQVLPYLRCVHSGRSLHRVQHAPARRVCHYPGSVQSVDQSSAVLTALIRTEHEEQREFVSKFRQSFPDVRIMAIPNGGARSKATAGRLKLEGVSSGVPDLFIPAWGLWIEMKRTKKGAVSSEQKDWIEYLDRVGYTATVCRGADEAMRYVKAFKGSASQSYPPGCQTVWLLP